MSAAHIPADALEALRAAGGCEHTPEPQRGCDTCGRPPAPWAGAAKAVAAYDWRAELVGGQVLEKRDLLSISNLPLDQVLKLEVFTDSKRIPRVQLIVDPRRGERLFHFTRHALHLNVRTGRSEKISVPVFEVALDAERKRCMRLYLHPVEGPILATEDLHW